MNGPSAPEPFDPGLLHLASDLRRRGVEPRRGDFIAVRHGVWMEPKLFAALTPVQAHAAFVHATRLRMRLVDPVFARDSAASVWGMPRIGCYPKRVHLHVDDRHLRGSRIIQVHEGEPTTPVLRHGILATPPARTVIDLARFEPLEQGMAAADHALRHTLCSREDLWAEVAQIPKGGHGASTARLVAELADADSMSAGESLSRTQMFLLDLPRPRLQVSHHDDKGHIGDVDFDWDGVIGEFDGKLKYTVPADADPQQAGEVVWREKKREDRLRRIRNNTTKVARWTWDIALDRAALAGVLAEVGIRSQPRNTWVDLAARPRRSA